MAAHGFDKEVAIGVSGESRKKVLLKEDFLGMLLRKTITELHVTEKAISVSTS
ncbi:hypothetical protein SESBI_21682 [Sesbania bispinosa]|nr:hypothetical protein SESBI_21682 [Sesbania bispinosa]